jgi:multimeric flavodoxin WrbA
MSNILILNGSPRVGGNTSIAIDEIVKTLNEEGIESEVVQIGNKDIRGCIACRKCAETGICVFDDIVNELAPKFEKADGLIVATPVYYASANPTLVACLDRLFFSTSFSKSMKVGASVVVARRGGCTATFDELNKFFTICGMPIASSEYWNCVHGREKGEAKEDIEGLRTMRVLARNMAFLIKSISLGKEKYGMPKDEERIYTNYIR